MDLILTELSKAELDMIANFLRTGCLPIPEDYVNDAQADEPVDQEVLEVFAMVGIDLKGLEWTKIPWNEDLRLGILKEVSSLHRIFSSTFKTFFFFSFSSLFRATYVTCYRQMLDVKQ